jgi:Protein of unknown function (DUF2783)
LTRVASWQRCPVQRATRNEMKLNIDPNLRDADAFYESLIEAHQGFDDVKSLRLNEQLVKSLKRVIGDPEVVREAEDYVAREGGDPASADAQLVLMLANHVGDEATLHAAFSIARAAIART